MYISTYTMYGSSKLLTEVEGKGKKKINSPILQCT
jgi:hypothetical protein